MCPADGPDPPWSVTVTDVDEMRRELNTHHVDVHGATHGVEPSMVIDLTADTPTDSAG